MVQFTAVGLYDYALTFDRELRYIWRYKFNWVSALFCVNRYTVPLTSALIFWKNGSSIHSGRVSELVLLSRLRTEISTGVSDTVLRVIYNINVPFADALGWYSAR